MNAVVENLYISELLPVIKSFFISRQWHVLKAASMYYCAVQRFRISIVVSAYENDRRVSFQNIFAFDTSSFYCSPNEWIHSVNRAFMSITIEIM